MKMDVVICTYDSARYLHQCLTGIRRVFDVKRFIVVDHYSKDKTQEIARSFNAEIYLENRGLAYALDVGICKAETQLFAIIDSDVELIPGVWQKQLEDKFNDPLVGGVGLRMFSDEPLWRQKFAAFWMRKKRLRDVRGGDWVNAYVIRRKALGENFWIPTVLKSCNHLYLYNTIIRNGYNITAVDAGESTHWYTETNKGFLMGAGERDMRGLSLKGIMRHVLTAPLKAIPPALAYRDVEIVSGNTQYWLEYLRGYLDPERYRGARPEALR